MIVFDELIKVEKEELIAIELSAKDRLEAAQENIRRLADMLEAQKQNLSEMVAEFNRSISYKKGRLEMLEMLAKNNGATPGEEEVTQPDAG